MTKVVLLGDSIRQIGYGKKVPAMLGDGYEVWQPTENCRFAQYTLRGMWDWKEHLDGADIVHWNNGLWDVCDLFGDGPFTDKETYVATMVRVAKILQTKAKKIILDNVHNGEVMLLHPTSATNAAILSDVIREVKSQGYRFGTLDELTQKEH